MGTGQSVALLTVDCLRADHVGCYGYERPTTPYIDSFSTNSTLFELSYSNSPGTRWALQSIHTGVHTDQIDGLGIPEQINALAERFSQNGFSTGAFVKNGFLTRDYQYDRGFSTFCGVEDFRAKQHPLHRFGAFVDQTAGSDWLRSTVLKPAFSIYQSTQDATSTEGFRPRVTDEEVCSRALEWIQEQQSTETPFFAWIHLMDAHTPYARWPDHLIALRGDTDIRHVFDPDEEIETGKPAPTAVIDAYDAGIRSADEQIGRILNALDSETAVAITGDHGEEFGRYNPFHTESFYSSMTQVPLIVRVPEMSSRRVSEYPVQHLDIPPTLTEAAGVDPAPMWQGDALQTTEREREFPIHFALSEGHNGIRRGEWKLIRRDDTEVELYHTPEHGDDTENVASLHTDIRNELATAIDEHVAWVAEYKIGRGRKNLEEDAAELSSATRSNLEELGYLED